MGPQMKKSTPGIFKNFGAPLLSLFGCTLLAYTNSDMGTTDDVDVWVPFAATYNTCCDKINWLDSKFISCSISFCFVNFMAIPLSYKFLAYVMILYMYNT